MPPHRTNSAPAPVHRRRRQGVQRFPFGLRLLWFAAPPVLLAIAILLTFRTVPMRNFLGEPVDVLVVLGSPATTSGAMTPMQYWRVSKAVHEYKRTQVPILFTGGAAANQFVESIVMKQGAMRMGVPPAAILTETASHTTLENIRNALPILQAHGWNRVEVISSPEHLPRAALLLAHTNLHWAVHASSTAFRPWWKGVIAYSTEAVATTMIRWFGLGTAPAIHAAAKWCNLQVWRMRVTWARFSHASVGTEP